MRTTLVSLALLPAGLSSAGCRATPPASAPPAVLRKNSVRPETGLI